MLPHAQQEVLPSPFQHFPNQGVPGPSLQAPAGSPKTTMTFPQLFTSCLGLPRRMQPKICIPSPLS